MAEGQLVSISIPFKYHKDPKKDYFLDRGEVIPLEGQKNDDVLVRNRYFVPVKLAQKKSIINCPDCGRKFLDVAFMHAHKSKRGGCFSKGRETTTAEIANILEVDADKIEKVGNSILGSADGVETV